VNYLCATNLSLSLNHKCIVDHVDIQVNSGEFIGLIGPNGAGKSSLLRLLAGLIKPNAGTILLAPQDTLTASEIIAAPIRARFMAYLAQQESLAWPLRVRDLVALGRIPWSASPKTENASRIDEALAMTEVGLLAESPITALSGGELQRVLLARVFAGKPKLIVADEPIAALDVYHQLHIMELLQAHARAGGAIIAALHDLNLAARFCSKLVLLHHGKILAEGEPYKVLTAENIARVYGVSAQVDNSENVLKITPLTRIPNKN